VRTLNHGASFALPRRIFQIASRLGDGRPLVRADSGAAAAVRRGSCEAGDRHGADGRVGVALYTLLKRLFVRERPFITHTAIDPAAAPLDRYSFPSGHTLHAVSFAWQASAHFSGAGLGALPLAGTDCRLARGSGPALTPRMCSPGRRSAPRWQSWACQSGKLPSACACLFISDVYFPRVNGVSHFHPHVRQDLVDHGVDTRLVAPRYDARPTPRPKSQRAARAGGARAA